MNLFNGESILSLNIYSIFSVTFLSDKSNNSEASSKRNGTKYIAKPYSVCGEVNEGFYSHYIPFKKDVRSNT